MRLILALAALLAPALLRAEDAKKEPDEKTKLQVVEYMIKTPTNEADPVVAKAFLALDTEALPKKLREPARTKQIEINALVRTHDLKKAGQQVISDPSCRTVIHPQKDFKTYKAAGYDVELSDDERSDMEKITKCTENDMTCQFSLVIFYDKGSNKPRRLLLHPNDMLNISLARVRNPQAAGAQSNFFGISTGHLCKPLK